MPRTRKGAAQRRQKNRILKQAKGYHGSRGRQYRLGKESVYKAQADARIGRKLRKRDFRGLWITRISAACRQRGLRYSEFIDGCKKAGIALNRKMLSEIAATDPAAFDKIAEQAKAAAS
jgi:large subunit ribosomal protein L20